MIFGLIYEVRIPSCDHDWLRPAKTRIALTLVTGRTSVTHEKFIRSALTLFLFFSPSTVNQRTDPSRQQW